MSDHFKFKVMYEGEESDIVELFERHVLIQIKSSGKTILVTYKTLEENNFLRYNDNIERNNVVSLRWYKCQEGEEKNKEQKQWKTGQKKISIM